MLTAKACNKKKNTPYIFNIALLGEGGGGLGPKCYLISSFNRRPTFIGTWFAGRKPADQGSEICSWCFHESETGWCKLCPSRGARGGGGISPLRLLPTLTQEGDLCAARRWTRGGCGYRSVRPFTSAPNLTLQGDQPKDWRATNPKTGGRPTQTLAGADPRTRISLLPRSSTPNARLFRRMSKNHMVFICFHHSPVGLHLAAVRPTIACPEKMWKTCTNHPQTIHKPSTNH